MDHPGQVHTGPLCSQHSASPQGSLQSWGWGCCGSREPGGGSLLVPRHMFWWLIFCARRLNKNSTACGFGWFFRAHTWPPSRT